MANAPRIEQLAPDSAEGEGILAALREEMCERYAAGFPGEDSEPVIPEGMVLPTGKFLGIFIDNELVACGGVRILKPDIIEIKRMYVSPDFRQRGLGRKMLAALEEAGRSLRGKQAWLDTGPQQTEALNLYRSAGYHDIPAYNDMPPGTSWLGKRLR